MTKKPPRETREERLAKALRDNLARRKALMRSKRARTGAEGSKDGTDAIAQEKPEKVSP